MTYDVEIKSPNSNGYIASKRLDLNSITVLIAAFNEEEGIAPTICEMQKELKNPQIIVIDGKSSDRTVEIAKNLGADVFFQKNMGKGDAVSEGLKFINESSKYVVLTDADYTYPARHVKEMISVLDSYPDVGMVLGDRFNNTYAEESDRNKFYLGNRLLGFTQKIFNGIYLNDPFTGLRILRCDLINDWSPQSLGFDIEAEINDHIAKTGQRIIEIPIQYRKRVGKKKLGFRHGLEILRRILLQTFMK